MANLPAICVVRKILSAGINYMPAVKFFARLDLDPIGLFLDGHQLKKLISFIVWLRMRSMEQFGAGRQAAAIQFKLKIKLQIPLSACLTAKDQNLSQNNL
jgi:hypothetical protein